MQFTIYAIKSEISVMYYYKVELMKRFFLEYLRYPKSEIYRKQVEYITEPFPYIDWIENMDASHRGSMVSMDRFPFFNEAEKYGIITNKNNSCLFQCNSLWQAERMIFQPLRKCHQSFYILEKNGEHYGWISSLARQRLLS
ncbi:sporulation inhibitor of replication protein SirA [Halobacillus salinarum]|uniref:Sporulation inhibitor of replication protein SirA n=1 Tax=Halobacillus salinarum TaxID=2932257 RepID=A0ABY4EFQ4_9BACI|nr:sporulation inhibitor of replication protein SirA [Halobacillus salinarum]UOQ42964.1 sporulation inhibitor of replication protein SirA [Halobacillus salinarum]